MNILSILRVLFFKRKLKRMSGGDRAWICANAVIIQNVKIGEHSIIGVGAIVTEDVEPYTIVGGILAKLIKNRT